MSAGVRSENEGLCLKGSEVGVSGSTVYNYRLIDIDKKDN